MAWPSFTWDRRARQYRDARGRFVPRPAVRAALEESADKAAGEVETLAKSLQDGSIEIAEWQARTEAALKSLHVAHGAIGAGGWAQATAKDWSVVARRIKREYQHLRGFAIDLENGLPLDGRFLARARMYAGAGVGTFEAVRRSGDIAAGFDEERRTLGSSVSCGDCPAYAALGWQPVGTLPGIGEACACMSNCRCHFDRRRRGTRTEREAPMPSIALSAAGREPAPSLVADPEKCRQRRRVAARRDAVNAVPVRFFPGEPPTAAVEPRRVSSKGTLPKTADDEMARINALLPAGASPLTEDAVYVRYMEAANGSYIADRYMFLGETTLKNIAADADAGFAFMNSHRTGGMSQPSELPFGKAFCGRFERWTDGEGGTHCRALVGVYMLKGQRPNGLMGPSTDDIAAGIDGGTIFDVSVGIYGGEPLCDVCGNDINDMAACPHMPGSTRQMTPDQVAAQEARGVPGGKCSVTYNDAHCAEVSAVYDGAVPGAGFRKALSLAKAGKLDRTDLALARSTFASVANPGDFGESRRASGNPQEGIMPKINRSTILALLGLAGTGATDIEIEDDGDRAADLNITPPPASPPKPVIPAQPTAGGESLAVQLESLRADLAAERAARAADSRAAALRAHATDIESFATGLVKDGRLLPAAVPDVKRDLAQAVEDDIAHPVEAGRPTRLAMRKASFSAATPHGLTTESVAATPTDALAAFRAQLGLATAPAPPPQLVALNNGAQAGGPQPVTPERQLSLLQTTEQGRAAVALAGGPDAMLARIKAGAIGQSGHAAALA